MDRAFSPLSCFHLVPLGVAQGWYGLRRWRTARSACVAATPPSQPRLVPRLHVGRIVATEN